MKKSLVALALMGAFGGAYAQSSVVIYGTLDTGIQKTTNTANSFTERDDGKMIWGWQAGGGTEIMLSNNLSLGLEYLYSRYQDDKYEVEVGQGTAPATNPFLLNGGGTNLRVADRVFDTHALRATVGLRF